MHESESLEARLMAASEFGEVFEIKHPSLIEPRYFLLPEPQKILKNDLKFESIEKEDRYLRGLNRMEQNQLLFDMVSTKDVLNGHLGYVSYPLAIHVISVLVDKKICQVLNISPERGIYFITGSEPRRINKRENFMEVLNGNYKVENFKSDPDVFIIKDLKEGVPNRWVGVDDTGGVEFSGVGKYKYLTRVVLFGLR